GDGLNLYHINLSIGDRERFANIAGRLNITVAQALLDPFFYHKLGDKKISSFENLDPTTIYQGLLDTPKNQIEIWYDGRKMVKTKMRELYDEMLLFPLYNVLRVNAAQDRSGIFILQREVGLINKYEHYLPGFSVEKLTFKILE